MPSSRQWRHRVSDKGAKTEPTVADYDDSTGRKSDLLAAFEAHEAKSATEVKPAVIPAKAATPEPKPEGEAPADEGAEPKTDKPDDQGADEADKPDETKAAAPELEPPKNWTKARQEQFKELPDPAKRILLDRFREMDADYTKKTTEIAEQRKLHGAVEEIFAPHRDQLRQAGITPADAVRLWAQAELALSNPATRDQAFLDLASAYKFDVAKLTGATQGAGPTVDPNDPEAVAKAELDKILRPYLGPAEQKIADLEARLAKSESFQTTAQQSQRSAMAARVMSEIQEFANATDPSGALAHPYFADVENDMAFLAAGYAQMNQPTPPLEDLYQRAVRANPVTFERLSAAQRSSEDAKAKEAARAKAAQAKRAGSSVTGAAGSAQPKANGQAHDVSVRDLVSRAYDDVMAP